MGRFTVFADDGNPATEDIEIAQGGALHVGSIITPVVTYYGVVGPDTFWSIGASITTPYKVRIREAKLPVPPTPFNSAATVSKAEYDALKLTLAILVRQMGGAVTFGASDYAAARKAEISIIQYKDPWYQVVTVEDQ